MSLSRDFALHRSLHLDNLESLRNGVPSGLPTQLDDVSTILTTYDAALAKIGTDKHLTPEGKAAQLNAPRDAAHTAICRSGCAVAGNCPAGGAGTCAASGTAIPTISSTESTTFVLVIFALLAANTTRGTVCHACAL